MYTFYLCKEDGSAASFEAFELQGDAEVTPRAAAMLNQHPGCAFVNVWQGDRKAMRLDRETARELAFGRREGDQDAGRDC
jgi:hypothetical protein